MPASNRKTQETPVNFFIKQNQIEEAISKTEDTSTAYIILQNNILQSKYIEIVKLNVELTNKYEELENDNDALQKSKTCLQGHVKNEFYRAENYKSLEDFKTKTISKFIKLLFICNLISIFYMMLIFTPFEFKYECSLLIIITGFHIYILYDRTNKICKAIKNNKINDIISDIKEIENSNKYLEELVDNF
jgi:hypothetical protein